MKSLSLPMCDRRCQIQTSSAAYGTVEYPPWHPSGFVDPASHLQVLDITEPLRSHQVKVTGYLGNLSKVTHDIHYRPEGCEHRFGIQSFKPQPLNYYCNVIPNVQKVHCPFRPIFPENLSCTMAQYNSHHLQNLFFFSPSQEAFY